MRELVPLEARMSQDPWTRFTGSYKPSDMNAGNKMSPLQKQLYVLVVI